MIAYVDDIRLTENDTTKIMNLKRYLAKEFEIKDVGDLRWALKLPTQKMVSSFPNESMFLICYRRQECYGVNLLILLLNRIIKWLSLE